MSLFEWLAQRLSPYLVKLPPDLVTRDELNKMGVDLSQQILQLETRVRATEARAEAIKDDLEQSVASLEVVAQEAKNKAQTTEDDFHMFAQVLKDNGFSVIPPT